MHFHTSSLAVAISLTLLTANRVQGAVIPLTHSTSVTSPVATPNPPPQDSLGRRSTLLNPKWRAPSSAHSNESPTPLNIGATVVIDKRRIGLNLNANGQPTAPLIRLPPILPARPDTSRKSTTRLRVMKPTKMDNTTNQLSFDKRPTISGIKANVRIGASGNGDKISRLLSLRTLSQTRRHALHRTSLNRTDAVVGLEVEVGRTGPSRLTKFGKVKRHINNSTRAARVKQLGWKPELRPSSPAVPVGSGDISLGTPKTTPSPIVVAQLAPHKRDGVIPGVPGTIDVTSPVYNSTAVRRLASLVLSADDSNPNSFVLDASSSSQTQVFLVPLSDTPSDDSTGALSVELHVPIFSKENAKMLAYCATFDPKSANLSPLTAQPCIDSRTEHVAQQFQYIPTTGVIKPLWPSDDTELNADGHPMPIVPQSIHVATSNSSIPIQAVETDAGGATLLAKADVTRNKTITATARGRPVNASSPMGVYMTNDHPRPPSSKQETSGKLVLVFTPSSAASILSSPNSTTINIKGKPHPRRALDRRDHPKDHLNMVRTSTRIPQEPSEDSLRPEPHLEPVKRDITALLASLIPVDPAPPYQWKFTPMDDMS